MFQSSSSIQNIQDLQIPHSSEIIIEDPPDPNPPDPVPLISAVAFPEHDYSASSNNIISRLSKKLAEMEQKCAQLEKENSVLVAKNSKFEKENGELKSNKKLLRLKINALTKQNKTFKKKNSDYRSGIMPVNVQNQVVRKRLSHKLSEGQCDFWLSKKPRHRSKKWGPEDYSKSQRLSLLCNRAAYDFVREEIAPLPGFETARKKYSFVRVVPNQIIQATLFHLKQMIST